LTSNDDTAPSNEKTNDSADAWEDILGSTLAQKQNEMTEPAVKAGDVAPNVIAQVDRNTKVLAEVTPALLTHKKGLQIHQGRLRQVADHINHQTHQIQELLDTVAQLKRDITKLRNHMDSNAISELETEVLPADLLPRKGPT
jgi:uncharacterized coiled-coil protein SlyX